MSLGFGDGFAVAGLLACAALVGWQFNVLLGVAFLSACVTSASVGYTAAVGGSR